MIQCKPWQEGLGSWKAHLRCGKLLLLLASVPGLLIDGAFSLLCSGLLCAVRLGRLSLGLLSILGCILSLLLLLLLLVWLALSLTGVLLASAVLQLTLPILQGRQALRASCWGDFQV